ncbi:MAG: DEAD/DEAH box helicase family protein [Prevotella sp.]|nr:DEAD/DEAH box helicase family protein [Prevotella sp.]
MKIRDITYKTSYSKDRDNIAEAFYLPTMSASKRYDRATGYFSSTIFILSWGSLKEFVANQGKMRIICSPYITPVDQEAIYEGLKAKSDGENEKEKIFKEFYDVYNKEDLSAPERVLACLIAMGIIEVKVAIGKEDPNRLFHDKVGIFADEEDAIAFRGSINETFKGISDDGNFESFDVFTSWGAESDRERLLEIRKSFDELWNNYSPKIYVESLPDSIMALIKKHAVKQKNWEEALDEVKVIINKSAGWSADKRKGGKKPRPHQLAALENWVKAGKKGIFEHATGSGKTFTAMCAIRRELELNNPVLILVPSVGLLNQWKSELSDMFSDLQVEYLLCGDNNTQWKEGTTLKTFSSPTYTRFKRITIATMQTASSAAFIEKLYQSDKLMVVIDEVHRMGSPENRKFFSVKSGARLGLSATPRRYGDQTGTAAIMTYFGSIIEPVYSLKNAIDDDVLCKYVYHPIIASLNDEEQQDWDNISMKISKLYAISKDKEEVSNPAITRLLIKRARIIKNAKNKVDIAVNVVSNEYKEGQKWIVYCDNRDQLTEVLDKLNESGIRSYEYHSELKDSVKKETLKYFDEIGGVIVSIRCLDEGIDIPSASHALILASSQNPREFIQRRGRILRKSKNKIFAYLYDIIVIPADFNESDNHYRIVESELNRAIQFGEWSVDKKAVYDLKMIAIDNNVNFENLYEGIEDE